MSKDCKYSWKNFYVYLRSTLTGKLLGCFIVQFNRKLYVTGIEVNCNVITFKFKFNLTRLSELCRRFLILAKNFSHLNIIRKFKISNSYSSILSISREFLILNELF